MIPLFERVSMAGRTALGALVVVGMITGCRPAASSADAGDASRLLATDREWSALSSAGKNADSVSSYWTDDAHVALPGQAPVSGKTAIHAMVAGMFQLPGFHISWTPDSAIVASSGDLGYTYGSNEVTVPDSAGKLTTSHGRYLTVWRKGADGRWRCAEDYTTPGPG